MSIRTRLLLSVILLLGIVSAIALILFISTQKVNIASQKELVANKLVKEVFILNALTVDYRLHQSTRARAQWHAQHQHIEELSRDPIVSSDPVARAYLQAIQKDLATSHVTFELLFKNSGKTSPELEERLLGQLQIVLQSVVNSATLLSSHALQEQQTIKQFSDNLLILLIAVIALTILVNFFLLYRSVVIPITRLATIIRKVQTGDLTPRATETSKDEIGQFALTFNTMLDTIKDAHENLEQKVQERTAELQVANKDLESFSYSVSHDLRAPLRAIDGFSQILEEDYANKFDDKGKEVITTIRESTKKMGNLIDDLLTLSRIGRQAIKLQIIDMATIAKAIFVEVQQQSKPTHAITFTCADLPPAQADPTLIRHVWTNLLSNAIKYTSKKQQATITVGSKEQDGQTIYFIRDNGAGFDMKYKDKLFGVFQRLHDARDFEGTGVGLANVAKIITKHGGKVWAEGEVDKGATFYFTLSGKAS